MFALITYLYQIQLSYNIALIAGVVFGFTLVFGYGNELVAHTNAEFWSSTEGEVLNLREYSQHRSKGSTLYIVEPTVRYSVANIWYQVRDLAIIFSTNPQENKYHTKTLTQIKLALGQPSQFNRTTIILTFKKTLSNQTDSQSSIDL